MSFSHLPPESSASTPRSDGEVLPIQPFLKGPVPIVGIFGLSSDLNRAVGKDLALALRPRRADLLDDPRHFEHDSGCPDCGGLSELEKAVESAIRTSCPDFFIVSCPAEFEPRWLAGSFPDTAEAQKEAAQLQAAARTQDSRPSRIPAFDLAVNVIEASRLVEDLWKARTLLERDPGAPLPAAHREDDVLDVLFTQIETADVLVLAEADPSRPETVVEMRKLLGILNPSAIIVEWTSRSGADAIALHLGKGLFSADTSLMAARWCRILEKNPHTGRNSQGTRPGEWIPGFDSPETGIVGGVYRRYRPFHPGRLLGVIESRPSGILRSVGVGWVATESEMAFHWSQAAGGTLYFYPEGPWMAAEGGGDWEWDRPEFDGFESAWDSKHGDRHITLTLIGTEADVLLWMKELDACLLTDEEMASDWSRLEDPIRTAMEEELSVLKKVPPRFQVIQGEGRTPVEGRFEQGEGGQGTLPLGMARSRHASHLRLVSSQEGGPGPGPAAH